MRSLILAVLSTGLLLGASKAELQAQLAAAKAKIAAQEKENGILQEALKNSAGDHAQLAAAVRDRGQIKASLDALTVQTKNSQQENGRIATQAATQAANQATGQVTREVAAQAERNKAELAKAVKLVNAATKRQEANAARTVDDVVAANNSSVADVKDAVTTSNAAVNTNVTKVGDKVDDMALRIEEAKQAAHHQNLLLYFAALSPITLPLTQFLISRFNKPLAATNGSTPIH